MNFGIESYIRKTVVIDFTLNEQRTAPTELHETRAVLMQW
jgi:hypothetical protein